MADDQKRSHTLADHLLGQDVVHDHDGDADHDHDHFEFDPDERLEDNPIWIQDHVTLVTVGIDIEMIMVVIGLAVMRVRNVLSEQMVGERVTALLILGHSSMPWLAP